MRLKLCRSILIPVLAFPTLVLSQGLRFDHIGTQNGLSQINVTCIIQDDRGFIWVGTDDGLNRYDGYQFIIYRNNPKDSNSISNNFIGDIIQDHQGNIWITTKNGLNKLDTKTGMFVRYTHNPADTNSISRNELSKLTLDTDGNIWITTVAGGLDQFDIKKNIFIHRIQDTSGGVSTIYRDPENRLLAGTYRGKLYFFDKETRSPIKFRNKESKAGRSISSSIRCIFEDSKHRLWIGTEKDGLFLFNWTDSSFVQFKQDENSPASPSVNAILCLNEDEKGNLWVSAENAGLFIIDSKTGSLRSCSHDELDKLSINGNSIYAICKDKVGNMWLGAYSAGISIYKRNTGSFIHYRRNASSTSISNNFVWDIFEDSRKNIWVATDGGGVDKFDATNGRVTNYKRSNGMSGNYVLAIEEDDAGTIWMGTWGNGITLFDPQKNKFSDLKHIRLVPTNVYALAKTPDKKMWIGSTDGGLTCYDERSNTFTRFMNDPNDPNSISSNGVSALCADRAGNLWIGTFETGVCYLDLKANTFTNYKPAKDGKGITNSGVSDIFEDHAGNIWLSTFEGLNKFDPVTKKFTSYTTRQGLPSNIIYAAREKDKMIWISTNHGLSAFDPVSGIFKNYTTEDGLQEDEFKPHSALKASDGRLYFGGINGFNVFSPSDIVKPTGFSPVVVTSFQIFNKPVSNTTKDGDVPHLGQDISDTKLLSLSYKQTFFSIEYAALDFSSPNKRNYAFMLDRFDKEWNYVGSRNTTSYTNVPAGKYTFKVKYQNTMGLWSPVYSKLQIIVRPPFWLTWWFITLASLTVVGCVFTYIRIRLHSIKSQKIKLEMQVQKKTAEVVAQNDALEAQQVEINQKNESLQDLVHEKDNLLLEKEWLLKEIHHRVKNNFHIVSSLLEIQASYLKNKAALSAIKDSQHRIHSMSIIHQKLYQSDNLSIIHMPEYIYELVEYLRESYAIRENVGFSLQIDNIELNHASAITLGLILNEAITNAIKYAFAKTVHGKISISLTQISDSQLLLSIADNGRGLPIDFNSKIGASMGMELLQGLTDDLRGILSIETKNGTHIKVIFDYKPIALTNDSFSQ